MALYSTPRFLQGVFSFSGKGLDEPTPLGLRYVVPTGLTAQPLYLRAGNSTGELICVVLLRGGRTMRYFPIGAKADTHVSLRVVEDLPSGTTLDLHVAAPDGLTGTVVIDFGLVEV